MFICFAFSPFIQLTLPLITKSLPQRTSGSFKTVQSIILVFLIINKTKEEGVGTFK